MGIYRERVRHQVRENADTIYKLKKSIILLLIFCLTLNSLGQGKRCFADANSQVNVRIDYLEEVAVLTPGTGNSTKYYLSADNMKTWEMIDSVVDISALLTSKGSTIYFKGNKDEKAVAINLQPEDKSLKVTYTIKDGVGVIELNPAQPVEYRKGTNGAWKTAVNLMSTYLYEVKGATLYFRIPATASKRAGSVVTLRIPKRPSAPAVKLDGSKLLVTGLTVGVTQYRVGDNPVWTTFTSQNAKDKSIELSSLLGGSITNNTPIPAGIIEFRTLGFNKKVNSAIKEISVPLQVTFVNEMVSLSGTKLTILDSNTKKSYEYTRVEKNQAFNINTARWTAITSKNAVIIPRASIGDRIYVRVKSITDPTTKQIIPASTFRVLTVETITTTTK
jgi:hypothetical protein